MTLLKLNKSDLTVVIPISILTGQKPWSEFTGQVNHSEFLIGHYSEFSKPLNVFLIFKQECIPVGCVPPISVAGGGSQSGGGFTETPLHRHPLHRDPLHRDPVHKNPFTETSPSQRPSLHRDIPFTETFPSQRPSLHKDPLHRDSPRQRPPDRETSGQRPLHRHFPSQRPPVDRMTDRRKNIILPQTSFVGGNYL